MGTFLVTMGVFVLIAGLSFVMVRMLDQSLFANATEEQLTRLQQVNESQVWWLSRVIYTGFAGMCLFIIATLIAVQLSLGELASVTFHSLITTPIAALITASGYAFMRYLFCRFWV